MTKFTLVSTVFNEMRRLDQTIADLQAQTRQPAEIIITDAGSTDGTFERLQRWGQESPVPVVVLQKHRCNVAEGRNIAIAQASHALIASTDFGCRFKPGWLESLIAPFEQDPSLQVVGGGFTVIREEVKGLAAESDFVLSDGYPVKMDQYFSTSSRSIAYKKEVWETIGGYPEWLTLAADDTIFWRWILHYQFRYLLVPDPQVFWLRHKTFKAFGKEAYRYGLGDGESGINFRNFVSHVLETGLRYALFAALPVLGLACVLGGVWWPLLLLVPLLAGLRSYRFAWKRWQKWRSEGFGWRVLLACFQMIEVTRWYYIKGYWKGWQHPTAAQKAGRAQLKGKIH